MEQSSDNLNNEVEKMKEALETAQSNERIARLEARIAREENRILREKLRVTENMWQKAQDALKSIRARHHLKRMLRRCGLRLTDIQDFHVQNQLNWFISRGDRILRRGIERDRENDHQRERQTWHIGGSTNENLHTRLKSIFLVHLTIFLMFVSYFESFY